MYLSIINIHKYLKQKVAFGFGVEEQEFVVRREGPERWRAQGFRFVAYVADLDHGIQAQDAAQRSGVGFVSRAVNLAHGFLQRLDAVFKLLDEPELGFLARRDDVLVDHVHHGHGFHLHGADVVLQEDGLSCFALNDRNCLKAAITDKSRSKQAAKKTGSDNPHPHIPFFLFQPVWFVLAMQSLPGVYY